MNMNAKIKSSQIQESKRRTISTAAVKSKQENKIQT